VIIESNIKVYKYRWVVLFVYMILAVFSQILWATFPTITIEAVTFYDVSVIDIGLLSTIIMLVYIVVSFPASWVIDKHGLRVSIGIGAAFIGIFGLFRGLVGSSYPLVLISQIGIAIGQPFILNSLTTLAARWFPIKERSIVAGLGTLSIYLGMLLGIVITPYLTAKNSITDVLLFYGILALFGAVIFIIFARSRPVTPPCAPGMEERSHFIAGYKKILSQQKFLLLLLNFLIISGVFAAITTWIEVILIPRGFSNTQAGTLGGLMILGGILGTLVIPSLSEKYHKRVILITFAEVGGLLGLAGFTFGVSFLFLIITSFVMGFFLLGLSPICIQYAAEITHPTSEGTSNGLLSMIGQISGIGFVYIMSALKSQINGSMTFSLIALMVLMGLNILLSTTLREPKQRDSIRGE